MTSRKASELISQDLIESFLFSLTVSDHIELGWLRYPPAAGHKLDLQCGQHRLTGHMGHKTHSSYLHWQRIRKGYGKLLGLETLSFSQEVSSRQLVCFGTEFSSWSTLVYSSKGLVWLKNGYHDLTGFTAFVSYYLQTGTCKFFNYPPERKG